jgi:thioester reductase-like protein
MSAHPDGARPDPPAIEAWLCERVADLVELPVAAVEPHRPFTYYGLASIDAIALSAELEDRLGFAVPATLAWDHPTILAAARYLAIRAASAEETRPTPGDEPVPVPSLGPIEPAAPSLRKPAHRWRNVLLTGGTGFLGAHLLSELLLRTPARVHCLVRAGSEAEADRRLRETLDGCNLWDPDAARRIVPLPGDLAAPSLGLPDGEWERLAGTLDAVYHSGAEVSYVRPYAALEPANVFGTREVLRLAASATAKPVHFVSTLGVFYSTQMRAGAVVRESDPLPAPETLYIGRGYARSKWAAEALAAQARSLGLPVSVYRPGLLAAGSRTGCWNADDLISRLVRGCIQLGAAPELDVRLDLVPVDWAARVVVALSLEGDDSGTFHLNSRRPVRWTDLLAWVAAAGYPLRRLSYGRWLSELQEARESDWNPLDPLVTFFTEPVVEDGSRAPELYRLPRFDSRSTRKALARLGIRGARFDARTLTHSLQRLAAAGMLTSRRGPECRSSSHLVQAPRSPAFAE